MAGGPRTYDPEPGATPVLPDPASGCPLSVLDRLVVLPVVHLGFDGAVHTGRIEVHADVATDVEEFFALALRIGFPIERIAAASILGWDDERLMTDNVTSGFNYRTIANSLRMSWHSRGLAIDVNPRLNPYVRLRHGEVVVTPPGASWRPGRADGTLFPAHELVRFMKSCGWDWGGDWDLTTRGVVDYQHFEKPVAEPKPAERSPG